MPGLWQGLWFTTIAAIGATGRGRVDMCITYRGKRYPVEIKIRRDSKTLERGKAQLCEYVENLGCKEGWLVIFDRRKKTPWKRVRWLFMRQDVDVVWCGSFETTPWQFR